MNRIGFLADLSANNNNYIIERNKSIDRLLDIINSKCKESVEWFENIANIKEDEIRKNVISFNDEQKDIRAIIDCIRDYCSLNQIDLNTYISQHYSEERYISTIFLGTIKIKKEQPSREN